MFYRDDGLFAALEVDKRIMPDLWNPGFVFTFACPGSSTPLGTLTIKAMDVFARVRIDCFVLNDSLTNLFHRVAVLSPKKATGIQTMLVASSVVVIRRHVSHTLHSFDAGCAR